MHVEPVKRKILFACVTALFLTLVLAFIGPARAEAIQIFQPFGGKVKTYNPAPDGCVEAITIPVAIATAGLVWITVEEIEVGDPSPATVGLVRIDGIPIPFLTTIYKYGMYFVPDNYVLGTSFNVCNICGAAKNNLILEKICETGPVKELMQNVCELVAESCPITNIVHKIGTALPSVENVIPVPNVLDIAKKAACEFVDSIPFIGKILGELCNNSI